MNMNKLHQIMFLEVLNLFWISSRVLLGFSPSLTPGGLAMCARVDRLLSASQPCQMWALSTGKKL